MTLFETSRFVVRPLVDADFPNFFRLMSDPETMRYIRVPITEAEDLRSRFALWKAYAEKCPGLGVFVAERKDSGAFIGYCVARHVEFDPNGQEFEIGYTFAPEAWGNGYASELVPPLCQYCFEITSATKIVAFTNPENAASQRVLQKSGFRLVGTRVVYESTNNEFWVERNAVQRLPLRSEL